MRSSALRLPAPRAGRLPLGSIAFAVAAPALARLRPTALQRLLALLTRGPAVHPSPAVAAAAAARVERALAIAERCVRGTCLTRGLARFVLLRRAGVPVELVFGLDGTAEAPAGHCWLELDRRPYLERADPRAIFPEVFRVPGRGGGS